MNALASGPKLGAPNRVRTGCPCCRVEFGKGGWAGIIISASSFPAVLAEGWTYKVLNLSCLTLHEELCNQTKKIDSH